MFNAMCPLWSVPFEPNQDCSNLLLLSSCAKAAFIILIALTDLLLKTST